MSRGWSPGLPDCSPGTLSCAHRKAPRDLNSFRNNGICSPSPGVDQAQGAVRMNTWGRGRPRQLGGFCEGSMGECERVIPTEVLVEGVGPGEEGAAWGGGEALNAALRGGLSMGALDTTVKRAPAEGCQAENPSDSLRLCGPFELELPRGRSRSLGRLSALPFPGPAFTASASGMEVASPVGSILVPRADLGAGSPTVTSLSSEFHPT